MYSRVEPRVGEHDMLREGVAKEYGISLFRQYGEEQAAHYLGVDISTLKNWRRRGLIRATNLGVRKVRYLGLDIVDKLILGDKWRDTESETSKSANIGSLKNLEALPTAEHGLTAKPAKPDVFRLAQMTLGKPSKN